MLSVTFVSSSCKIFMWCLYYRPATNIPRMCRHASSIGFRLRCIYTAFWDDIHVLRTVLSHGRHSILCCSRYWVLLKNFIF